jgi:TolB protein
MPDSVNPYIPGQPVDNPKLFFGRRDIFASIREHLVKGRRTVVISGSRRMGKTSLLWQMPAHLPEEFVAVRLRLLELQEENAQRLDWLLWRIADAIGHALGGEGLAAHWDEFEANTSFLLDSFWPQVRAALGDRCLVLMLDDLDSLTGSVNGLLDSLLAVLSVWRDEDEELALVVTMSISSQEVLAREYPRLFGGALSFRLGPLSSEEATRLITWPVDSVIAYDYGIARRLIEITSGQPYYLQLLCFEVFNRCASEGWVNQRDLDLVIEDLVGREIAEFRQVWDDSEPQEQAVLATLVSLRGARGVATAQEVRTLLTKAGARVDRDQVIVPLESLTARGILERLGAFSYRFRVALLRDWLAERIDLEEVVRDTRWDGPGRAQVQAARPVRRLRPRKRRGVAASRPAPGPEEMAGDEEDLSARGPLGRWIALAAVLSVAALAVLWLTVWRTPPAEPTPTVAQLVSPTARLATATLTALPTETRPHATAVVPTDAPTPVPTFTPSPTPPLVVSRPVPSIAYQSKGQGEENWSIYVMNSDGSDRTRLTDGQFEAFSPVWSPADSRIAFGSDRDGALDIWVMDSDGSNLLNLTRHEAQDRWPAWSPDGQWIAFASVRDTLYWELYIMRSDGSDVQRLTWWDDASDWSPTWSPDGTRLAFASKRDGNWEIYAMDRDGSNLARLTDNPADDTNPAWSPDGSRIAFESTREGYTDIFVMPVVGGQATNLTNLSWATDLGPSWSPDGGRIVFYSDRNQNWDVYVMASDGSGVVQLTGDSSEDQVPAWRP